MEKVMKMVKVLKMTVTHGELNFILSGYQMLLTL